MFDLSVRYLSYGFENIEVPPFPHRKIVLDDPLLMKRTLLIDKIYGSLEAHSRILITAPLASGKTSAVQLLTEHILDMDFTNDTVSNVLYLNANDVQGASSPEAAMSKKAGLILEMPTNDMDIADILNMFDYVFIDDAELLFDDSMTFVDKVIKHSGPTKIALVSEYSIQAVDKAFPDVPDQVSDQMIG